MLLIYLHKKKVKNNLSQLELLVHGMGCVCVCVGGGGGQARGLPQHIRHDQSELDE